MTKICLIYSEKYIFTAVIVLQILFIQLGYAKSDYKHLPKLDGKIDSIQNDSSNMENKQNINTVKSNSEIKVEIPSKSDLSSEPEKKISATSPAKIDSKDYKSATTDTPKLDIINSAVSSVSPSDNLNFTIFFNDINLLMPDIRDLQNFISQGTTLQLFSAKTTTIMFRSKAFLKKYKDKTFSNFESYKLIENIVNNSVYTKDIWFQTNQIKTNQHNIPNKILQTKFLQISTDIDKLKEILQVHDEMSNE